MQCSGRAQMRAQQQQQQQTGRSSPQDAHTNNRRDAQNEASDELAPLAAAAAEKHDTQQQDAAKRAFDRLDPNRRSLSSPSVNAIAPHDKQRRWRALVSRGRAATSIVASKPSVTAAAAAAAAPASATSKGNKLRRRTVLGLISFGSTHSKPDAAVPVCSPHTVGSQNGLARPSASNGWRTWFSAAAAAAASNGSVGVGKMETHAKSAQKRKNDDSNADEMQQQQQRQDQPEASPAAVSRASRTRSPGRSDSSSSGSSSSGSESSCCCSKTNCDTTFSDELHSQEAAQQVADMRPREPTKQPSKEMQQQQQQQQCKPTSLVDRLIDSEIEWRTLMREANGGCNALEALTETQIKRQEVIHELVQTERHHCLTLALMRQVYLSGLHRLNEARHRQYNSSGINKSDTQQTSQQQQQQQQQQQPSDLIDLERLFPALDELIQAHELFFAHLRLRLVESCSDARKNSDGHLLGLVGPLGDLLCDQFRLHARKQPEVQAVDISHEQQQTTKTCEPVAATTSNGRKLLAAYAKFCGQQCDSTRYYKHLMQNDKGFKQFIETCQKLNAQCRQRGIPECNLLVTQRLTKYPLLIEQLIKTSKDDAQEAAKLSEALTECKALIAELNSELARKESFERLLDIYAQFCPKSHTRYGRTVRFTKHDLLQQKRLRQLLHSDSQVRVWSAQRRKLFHVLCLILNDIVVFLRIESCPVSGGAPATNATTTTTTTTTTSTTTTASAAATPQHEPQNNVAAASAEHSDSQHATDIAEPLSSWPPSVAASIAGAAGSSGTGVRYCFANIDNKSSVIPLGKLLIRDKAVNEAEPRTYLISSVAREPEMYELAFVSKRHQTTFIDKLKSCIERRERDADLYGPFDDEDEEEEDDVETLDSVAESSDDDDDECVSYDSIAASDSAHSDDLLAKCSVSERSFAVYDADEDNEESDTANKRTQRVQESEFELDIEQELVLAPDDQPEEEEDDDDASPEQTGSAKVSAESGLSERAKDSMDEAAPSKQRMLRGTNRRRRAQRPRNVSNQSSSSSEAAHCHALAQSVAVSAPAAAATETTSDSGRGHDSSSSAASTSSNSMVPQQQLASPVSPNVASSQKSASRHSTIDSNASTASSAKDSHAHKIIDLKLLKSNISLSTSSIASTLMGSLTGNTAAATVAKQQQQQQSRRATCESAKSMGNIAAASSCASSSSSASSTSSSAASPNNTNNNNNNANGNSNSAAALPTPKKTNLVKCSSILSKSSFIYSSNNNNNSNKQRKMSTVSCMSSASQPPLTKGSKRAQMSDHCALCAHCQAHNSNRQSTLSKHGRQQTRRTSFVPEKTLEEIRNAAMQMHREKEEWLEKYDRMQEQLLSERHLMDVERAKLRLERQQVANEREQLYRKLDVLKENGIILSPTMRVIITSPELCAHFICQHCNRTLNRQPFGVIDLQTAQQHTYQQHYSQPTQQQQQQQPHYNIVPQQVATNGRLQMQLPQQQQQQQQQSQCKVPLHLSKTGSCAASQQQQSHVFVAGSSSLPTRSPSSSSSLLPPFARVPLLGALSAGLGLTSSRSSMVSQSAAQHSIESHLI